MVKAFDVVAPAGTLTAPGTPHAGLSLVSCTVMPPVGAGAFKTTVFAVVVRLPTTVAGET
jgi:hypothetical protein